MNPARRITITDTGRTFECKPGESVFEAMRRSEGPLCCGCFGGGCGACRMRVLEGQFETFKKMSRAHITPRQEEQGAVLTCCIRPLSDMKLALTPINEQERKVPHGD